MTITSEGSPILVRLAMEAQGCNQRELATRLGVSQGQISKWKAGEHMSSDMEHNLRQLALIGHWSPVFVDWAGGLNDARNWESLIFFLAEHAAQSAETGYDTLPLRLDEDFIDTRDEICERTILALNAMGVPKPSSYPKALLKLDDSTDAKSEKLWACLEDNPYSFLIHQMFLELNNVYAFYAAYISPIYAAAPLEYHEQYIDFNCQLFFLAATKIELPDKDKFFASVMPAFRKFCRKTRENCRVLLQSLKEASYSAGIPLRAELMDLVNVSGDQLGMNAEAEALGFNDSRIHPDIYMNELLVSSRIIHQVLPAIIEKLGINFVLDESSVALRDETRKP